MPYNTAPSPEWQQRHDQTLQSSLCRQRRDPILHTDTTSHGNSEAIERLGETTAEVTRDAEGGQPACRSLPSLPRRARSPEGDDRAAYRAGVFRATPARTSR
jgi:hypothetical protein